MRMGSKAPVEPWPCLKHRIIGVEKNHIKSSISPLWPMGGSAVTELFLTAAHPSCSQRQPPVMETFQLPEIIPSRPAVEPGVVPASAGGQGSALGPVESFREREKKGSQLLGCASKLRFSAAPLSCTASLLPFP